MTRDITLWLDEALAGLDAQAATRLRGEYRAHYEDAVRGYEVSLPRLEAHRQALADLGDSREVNCRLLSSYLTEGERRRVTALSQDRSVPVAVALIALTLGIAWASPGLAGFRPTLVALSVVMALLVVARVLLWRGASRERAAFVSLVLNPVFGVAGAAAVTLFPPTVGNRPGYLLSYLTFTVITLAIWVVRDLPLARKLSRATG